MPAAPPHCRAGLACSPRRTRALGDSCELYAAVAVKTAAATTTLSSTSTRICWRHSRRNMRHAQRTIAATSGHARGAEPGVSSDSGPGAGAVWSTMRPSRRNTTRSAHDASCASWVTNDAGDAALARGAQEAHDGLAVGGVERTGGLVGEQQVPVADDGAGDRDPLAFAAGEVVREAVGARADIERLERFHRGRAGGAQPDAVELQRQRHVLDRGESGEEVEVLEHVADRSPAQAGAVVARQRAQCDIGDEDLTARRLLEAAGDRQQRALARAARAHDRDELAARDGEVDVAQRVHLGRAVAVDLGDARELERDGHRATSDSAERQGRDVADVAAGAPCRSTRASALSSQRMSASSR